MSQSQDIEQAQQMQLEAQGHQEAARVAAAEAKELLKNPEFLSQIQDADIDTDLFDWVEDEFGPVFSGAHILGNREDHFEEQQEMLNRNKSERMIAERSPGRLLREDPHKLALAQGLQGTPTYPDPTQRPEFREPLTSRKRRVIRDAAEVATTRQTLAIAMGAIDAVANATVENRTISNEEKTESRAAGVKEVFR
jgi:hypothetical protein